MTTLQPGQTTYRQWGALNIRIDMHTDGVAITVDHHPTLNRSFTSLDQGRAYLEFLRDEAKASKPVWLIEAGAGVLTSTAAVLDGEQELIDSINADGDRYLAAEVAAHNQVVATVAEVKAEQVETDAQWRARIRREAATLAQASKPRDFTKGRVHCKPLTVAELDLVRSHRNGEVTTKPGQSWLVLRAIVRRGYGTPVYGTGQRIVSVTLNQRGFTAAQTSEERAA